MPDELVFGTSVFIALSLLAVVLLVLWAVPVRLWIEAISAGVHVRMTCFVGMRLRNVPPALIVRPLIWATKGGLSLDISQLEAHHLRRLWVGLLDDSPPRLLRRPPVHHGCSLCINGARGGVSSFTGKCLDDPVVKILSPW